MPYNVTQRDMDILYQKSKEIYVKIQILNPDFSVVYEIQGETIDGSYSIDANSDIRRTYESAIHIKDNEFIVDFKNKIWLDKHLKISLGMYHLRTQEIVYYPLGFFLFNDNNFSYNETTRQLSISCLDLMAKLTGIRNGQVSGLSTQILVGSNIRDVLVSTVGQLGKFNKYIIDDIGKTIPYDLNFSTGSTVYDIISKIRDLYPAWETFIDLDGVFRYQQIPTCINDNIVFNKDIMKQLVISEDLSNSFSEVKNKTEIWGKSIRADRFTDVCTNTSNQYNITLENFELKSNIRIAFKPNINSLQNPTLKINQLAAYGIYHENEKFIDPNTLNANTSYVVRFRNDKFYLMGQFQIHAVAMDMEPSSPFYVGNNGENVVLQVLSGSDYEKIYSDELCQERADYENWKATRLTDTITLEMILIPWLDVNQKLEYMSAVTHKTEQYITKNIQFDIQSGTMTVTMIKFYPLYPEIIKTTLTYE